MYRISVLDTKIKNLEGSYMVFIFSNNYLSTFLTVDPGFRLVYKIYISTSIRYFSPVHLFTCKHGSVSH